MKNIDYIEGCPCDDCTKARAEEEREAVLADTLFAASPPPGFNLPGLSGYTFQPWWAGMGLTLSKGERASLRTALDEQIMVATERELSLKFSADEAERDADRTSMQLRELDSELRRTKARREEQGKLLRARRQDYREAAERVAHLKAIQGKLKALGS